MKAHRVKVPMLFSGIGHAFLVVLLLGLGPFGLAGCGGGGGGGGTGGGATTVTVSGTIVDSNGAPVASATVTITSTPVTTQTNAGGGFSAQVEPGAHHLTASKGGTIFLEMDFTAMAGAPMALGTLQPTITFPLPTTGTLSGKLLVGPSASQKPRAKASGGQAKTAAPAEAEFVIGEVIVKFDDQTIIADGIAHLQTTFPDEGLEKKDEITIINAATLRSGLFYDYRENRIDKTVGRARTLDLIERIAAQPGVVRAEPNHVATAQAIPNDPLYAQQWHYPFISLPQAWEIFTEEPGKGVVVAVLDTGIYPEHPDLKDQRVPGYDFVSDPLSSGDGGGIDPDPTAVPWARDGGIHGTHVAGTIAAASNNRQDVAGVAWGAKVMPVRVLGIGGGTDSDIIQGLLFAAGLPNASGTVSAQPAKVINMSLGRGGFPNASVQDVIDAVAAQSVTIIAAAGNDAEQGNPVNYPCAYDHVICVGAVGPTGERASYSEFNSFVDVAAPGGMGRGVSYENVLSTSWDVNSNRPKNEFLPGTSMATPHVAGVAALLLSLDPTLTPTQVETALTTTAVDLGPAGRDLEYGAGLVNAYLAVKMVKDGALPGAPVLYVQPDVLYLDAALSQAALEVRNLGGGTIHVTSVTDVEDTGGDWLSTQLSATTTPATLTIRANPVGLGASFFTGTVTVTTDVDTEVIRVVLDNRPPPNLGTVLVELYDANGDLAGQTTASAAQGYAYTFTDLPPGGYFVAAGSDRDGSGVPADNWGEFVGVFPMLGTPASVQIEAGQTTGSIDFRLTDLGDLIWEDGNGLGPINGALLVQVKDAYGNPIEGSTIYVGDGAAATAMTNIFGRKTILGSFSGPQTVTATAPGYTTQTYWQTNASYLTFNLDPVNPGTVTLNLAITGLSSGESGIVYAGGDFLTFTASGASVLPTFQVPKNEPLAVSVITYDLLGNGYQFAYQLYPEGLATNTTDTLLVAPALWGRFAGSMVLPTGNFNLSSGVSMGGFGYAYLGLNDPLIWTGTSIVLNPLFSVVDFALTDAPDWNAVGFLAANGLGEVSFASTQGPFFSLPATGTFFLSDVPGLTAPADGTTVVSMTPTFSWTNTFDPSAELVTVSDPASGWEWEIVTDGLVRSVTLPAIPTGGLGAGTSYNWEVTNTVSSFFDFNDFNKQFVEQNLSDLSISRFLSFSTP
ncbi:MAG: S8 family serine peptidase [Leptospirillia bacterium]